MTLLLSETFEIVTDESARHNDAADRGFIREDEPVTVKDAIGALRECCEPSSSPIRPETVTGYEWASTEAQQDYRTGEYESRSIHVKRADGTRLSGRQLFRLFRAAGLAFGTL